MGDRTSFQITIYDCPPTKAAAVMGVIERLGLGQGWGTVVPDYSKLDLNRSYNADEVYCGSSDEVASELIEIGGVSFECWEDPKYEWLGSLNRYTPDLGLFSANCDSDGTPQFDDSELTRLLQENADLTCRKFLDQVLPKATGGAWDVALGAIAERVGPITLDATPKEDEEPDQDDLAWAREDMGPNATANEVYEVAARRARERAREEG